MSGEVAEVVDVMTRSGYLMYEIVAWSGWAAAGAARLVAGLVQNLHRRYGLNGQVQLKALQRLSMQGVPLATGQVDRADLETLQQFAAECGIPFAVTQVPGADSVLVTFREQDIALLSPVLTELGARRLRGSAQLEALRASDETELPACPPGPLSAVLIRADASRQQDLAGTLRRLGVHAVSGPAADSPEAGAAGQEIVLYPQSEEETVRQAVRELDLDAEFCGPAARPLGAERQTFADRRQQLRHRQQETTERSAPARAAPPERSGPDRAGLAAVHVPAGPPAEALAAALAQRQIAAVRLNAAGGEFLVAGQEAAALLDALQAAGVSAPVLPATAAQAEAAAGRLPALEREPPGADATVPGPPIAQLRDWSTLGAERLAQDPDLALFVHMAACNPELTAKNIFAAAGQGADGLLAPAEAWIRSGAALAPGAQCIWTGEPRRDAQGHLIRQLDPSTGRSAVRMDMQRLVCESQVQSGAGRLRGRPEPPDPEVLRPLLTAEDPARAGRPPARLLAEHVLREYRRQPGAPGPPAEAEAALAARIVLERWSMPVPADMPQLDVEALRSPLGQPQPSFAPFERARTAAAAVIRDLESRLQRQPTFAQSIRPQAAER